MVRAWGQGAPAIENWPLVTSAIDRMLTDCQPTSTAMPRVLPISSMHSRVTRTSTRPTQLAAELHASLPRPPSTSTACAPSLICLCSSSGQAQVHMSFTVPSLHPSPPACDPRSHHTPRPWPASSQRMLAPEPKQAAPSRGPHAPSGQPLQGSPFRATMVPHIHAHTHSPAALPRPVARRGLQAGRRCTSKALPWRPAAKPR